MNKILNVFDIKESWRTCAIVVWSLFALRIIIFVYEVDLDPNEHIMDWIKFSLASLVFIVPFTVVYLFIAMVISKGSARRRN
mgnify:CR=1 FL=1